MTGPDMAPEADPASDRASDRASDPVGRPAATPDNPYIGLPPHAFWRSGVVDADRVRFPDLYRPTFAITRDTAVATAGSCFAQHIGAALRLAGCNLLDAEPAPTLMPDATARRFGYRLFSGRYANVYTARQLRQLLQDAADLHIDPRLVWERDGTFVDALRPMVEPAGLGSPQEVMLHRKAHLTRVAAMLRKAEVFVFTLGLTEAWEDGATARVFPVCPGVAGGRFDATAHLFRNFRHAEICADIAAIHALLQDFRPGMRLLLTVSPVPLTATATGNHVLAASTWSKSTLRAAAGECAETLAGVDYFPSYELVSQPFASPSDGHCFAANLRSVRPEAVARVMRIFLDAHGLDIGEAGAMQDRAAPMAREDDDGGDGLICEELLLQAFHT